MAGAFGYGADTHQASVAMGELSLLPAVRKAAPEAVIAADGFSCRHQIHDGTPPQRPARLPHIVQCDGCHTCRCDRLIFCTNAVGAC
jgi:hypothetical protein